MSNSSSSNVVPNCALKSSISVCALTRKRPLGLGDDVVLALVEVVLVLDVADDLLEHVLDGDEARHAAVLVDDDRDVVAVGAEVAQQHVEPLRLGHEHRRAQRVAQVEARPASRSSCSSSLASRMPTTSSLFSPITGKRECLVSMIERDELGGASSIDTQSICARGIMMSRTVVSDTDSTPSIIDSASASSSWRSNAPRRSCDQLLAVLGLARQERRQPLEQRRLVVGRLESVVAIDAARARPGRGARTDRGTPSRARIADFARLHARARRRRAS